ncbi:hypothetical protein ACM614_18225 [Streptomyces sp. 12297]|uniref:hypothetical protein n=1 Tax=Streptomyces sp. NBC_00239 TaxID=2903640 RepID=UPI002E28F9CD|nr:hypothetical protein [Streptomyces sp. NBC_00239]
MTVDPTEPDTFQQLQEAPDVEAPEADAVEQRIELNPRDDDDPPAVRGGGDAAEADAAEQARVVPLDDDDYR